MGYFKNQSGEQPSKASGGNAYGLSTTEMYEAQNTFIKIWIPKVRRALKASARGHFPDGKNTGFVTRGRKKGKPHTEGKLADSITSRTGKHLETIERISFNFERHGVFVHKGVGRGYPSSGKQKIDNPSGKTRKPIEWFNPVIDKYIPELADKIAEINADAAVNATTMKIR
jgi:hypothetical protein